jgi:hypothetical protein
MEEMEMPAKKAAKTRRPAKKTRRPAGPKLEDRITALETTVANLVVVAERHGDPITPKSPEETPVTA